MNMPGFTAEASLYDSKNVGCQISNGVISNSGQLVIPQLRKWHQTICRRGSEGLCDSYCSYMGGGMVSNPDGSVSCWYLLDW